MKDHGIIICWKSGAAQGSELASYRQYSSCPLDGVARAPSAGAGVGAGRFGNASPAQPSAQRPAPSRVPSPPRSPVQCTRGFSPTSSDV